MEKEKLKKLSEIRLLPNWKIFLFYAVWILCCVIAWHTPNIWIKIICFGIAGYFQMGIVTFMHECTHNTLFKKKWQNFYAGIFMMIPFVISFISFKDDHLRHHRYNRTEKDPDAAFMGNRNVGDFLVYYGYIFFGIFLSVIQFTFIYPFQYFRGKKLFIHIGENILHFACYYFIYQWAVLHGVENKLFEVFWGPLISFSLLNSIRFVTEHHGTPWDKGQLAGSRTITSNPVHSFCWNNINWHIGHHVYPTVPWYNLQLLHKEILPDIEEQGAEVRKSTFAVFWEAFKHGPESIESNKLRLLKRNGQSQELTDLKENEGLV